MKTSRLFTFLCAALCLATSCHKAVDMTLMQKTLFENADIRQIEASDAWQVKVVYDTVDTFVEVEYSAYLENCLNIKMEDDKLHIGFMSKVYAEPGSVFTATVHTAKMESIEAHDASCVKFEGGHFTATSDTLFVDLTDASVCTGLEYSGHNCKITVEEVSHFLDFQLHSVNCFVNVSEASSCKGSFEVSFHLVGDLSDASQLITFGGMAPYGMFKIQEASLLNIVQTEIQELYVDLSGASEATVWTLDKLSGSLKEASTLYFKGQPQIDIDCSDDSHLIPF